MCRRGVTDILSESEHVEMGSACNLQEVAEIGGPGAPSYKG